MAVARDLKIFWSQLEYLGGLSCAPFMLMFAIRQTGALRRIPAWLALLLFLPNVLVMGLAVTNPWHWLVWTGFADGPSGTNSLIYQHGPVFFLAVVIAFAYAMLGSILLVNGMVRTRRAFRGHNLIILVAVLFCWVTSFLYASVTACFPGLDISPLGLGFTAVLVSFGMYRMRMFDLRTLARDQVLEHMHDGLLVLDGQDRLVDHNPSAKRILGSTMGLEIGEPVKWPDDAFREAVAADSPAVDLCLSGDSGAEGWYSIKRIAISADAERWAIITLHEVTERKQAEDRLREQYQRILELETMLRDQAIRDSLTGLFNRRYLDEAIRRDIGRAKREGVPLAVLMIDLDHFKKVNDAYGHAAGDQVLVGLGQLLRGFFRDSDIACRYGGEEFVALLWGTGLLAGGAKADELRLAFAGMDLGLGLGLTPTLSVGVAAFPDQGEDGDTLLRAADRALYRAKQAGRNRIVLAE